MVFPIKKFLRTLFVLFGAMVGVALSFLIIDLLDRYFGVILSDRMPSYAMVLAVMGMGILFALAAFALFARVAGGIARLMRQFEKRLSKVPTKDLLLGLGGLLLGLLLAFILGQAVGLLQSPLLTVAINFVLYLVFGLTGVRIALSRRTEVQLSMLKQRMDQYTPGEPFVLVDTSVIIDGRILDLCKTGFLSQTLVIPSFVLTELKRVADSPDEQKRSRGRRGLDTLSQLQELKGLIVHLDEADYPGADIGEKLLAMAAERGAPVLTTDYALEKTAPLKGVRILNINELANAVKTVLLPGDRLTVTVTREGREAGQGVAYLEDGTMLVVENGRRAVGGKPVSVTVTSVLQTNAGRMIFARIHD